MTKAKPKFLRKDAHKYSKLGKGRKNKQRWKKPTGRHNKMRNQMKGHPATVSIGYSKGELNKKKFVIVKNLKELEKAGKNAEIVLGKIGAKNKIEIAKKAKELKIKIVNLNAEKYIKKTERKSKKNKENKK